MSKSGRARAKGSTRRGGQRQPGVRAVRAVAAEMREIEALRRELEQVARTSAPARWNADPEDVRRSGAKLVLTLVEFIRQLLERQGMDAGTLSAGQIEDIGQALMRLEETVRDIGAQFGLTPENLNLHLGPIGRLM